MGRSSLIIVALVFAGLPACSDAPAPSQGQSAEPAAMSATNPCAGPDPAITVARARAGDAERGQKLYEQSCRQCHGTEIHTRKETIIFSYNALINRIQFCERMANAHWQPQDFADVAKYLNDTFYHFQD